MNAISQILPRVTLRQLSQIGFGNINGFSLWHYHAEKVSDVFVPSYFDDADYMKAGDHIHVSAPNGGAVLYVEKHGKVTAMCWCEVVEEDLDA